MILSIGSINVDLEFRGVASLDKHGTIRTSEFTERAGGKAANVAFLTHRWGVPTKLLARTGRDYYAEVATASLRKAGLDLSTVTTTDHAPTGIAIVAIARGGEKTMLNASNANMDWDTKAIEAVCDRIRRAPSGSILIANYEIPKPVLHNAFTTAEERGLRILVDPTFPEETDLSSLHRFTAITPNQKEAAGLLNREITTQEEAAVAARELSRYGVDVVCLKLSDGGCAFCENGEVELLPAPTVKVVDKTGAGDAFIGAFAVAILEGHCSLEAARWGVAASSLSVENRGAQASYPTREELLTFLQDHTRGSDS
nr:PfkB domain-containing protein [Rhizobium sp. Q54]